MAKKQLNYNTKLIEELRSTPFYAFGIIASDDFNMTDILTHIKTFNNCLELENELNKLVCYVYDKNRTIFFHDFRQFPYIRHGNDNLADNSGLAQNYTSSDIYLIKFIKNFIEYKNGKYSFFDVDFIIANTKRIEFTECCLNDMPIDEIIK